MSFAGCLIGSPPQGWQHENVVARFGEDRVILVRSDEPVSHLPKVTLLAIHAGLVRALSPLSAEALCVAQQLPEPVMCRSGLWPTLVLLFCSKCTPTCSYVPDQLSDIVQMMNRDLGGVDAPRPVAPHEYVS